MGQQLIKLISNIVFTKNRPLQLDAYLESLYRYIPAGLIQTYIIYKQQLFDGQYQQLFRNYEDCIVIKENDFYKDFLNLLSQIKTKFILFGVDDVVYFDSVDFNVIDETFDKFANDIFGFSLRFGGNVKNGDDPISETLVGGQIVYSINWTQGRTSNTCYPFELCATIYQAGLVKRVINSAMNNNPMVKKLFSPSAGLVKFLGAMVSKHKILKRVGYFYNPNSLESWNCRWCQNNSDKLPGLLFFQKLCASEIQVNMVNISARKSFDASAEHTVEALADKYKQGYRVDIDYVAQNKPSDAHSGPEYFKLIRNKALSGV